MIDLLERLNRITPDSLTKFFFCQSGSEAVDNAIKLARASTGRQNVIAFQGGYHGRTYGAMSITTSKTIYRQAFGPLPSGTAVANYPYCLHCKARIAAGGLAHGICEIPSIDSHGGPGSAKTPPYESRQCCNGPLDDLHMLLKTQSHPKDTAAIIIEPILGEGGFLVPPPGFLSELRKICDEHGIVLIFDEVQAGLGRTGTWFSHQLLTTAQPDVLIFAKGIASGFPFAGLAAREDLFVNSDGSNNERMEAGMMGGTYGSSPMGCAAAVATIDVIEDEKLLENAKIRGEQLANGLNAIASRSGDSDSSIIEVRGRGLMVAAELRGKPGVAARAVKIAGQHGVLMLTCGARETVRFLPPLVVTAEQVDRALEVFELALKEA
jgi:4-aminobutyrate aminotransferase